MKRYIKSSQNNTQFKDLVNGIVAIIIVPDARVIQTNINASTDIYYGDMSDEELSELTSYEIYDIDDPEVLVKLYRIDPTKLTKRQRFTAKLYAADFATKKLNYPKDIQTVIDYLHNCNYIKDNDRDENSDFDELFHYSSNDKLEVIHNLTIQDYVANTRSKNDRYLGNDLIIFEPFIEIPSDIHKNNDTIKEQIQIYVKLDLSATTRNGDIVTYVSFHDLERRPDYRPYRDKPISDDSNDAEDDSDIIIYPSEK